MRETLLNSSTGVMENRPILKHNVRVQPPSESPFANRAQKRRFVEEPKSHEKIASINERRSLNRSLSGRQLENQYISKRKESLESSPLRTSRKMYKEDEIAHSREIDVKKREEIRKQAFETFQSKSTSLCDQDFAHLKSQAIQDPHIPLTMSRRFMREPTQIQSPKHRGGIRTFTTQSNIRLG